MEVQGSSGRGRWLQHHFFAPERGPVKPVQVRLKALGPHTLQVELLDLGEVTATRVLEVEVDPGDGKTRGRSLRVQTPTKSGTSNLGVGWNSSELRLHRGSDGALYGEKRESGGGLFGFIIPIYHSDSRWVRWERVEPQAASEPQR